MDDNEIVQATFAEFRSFKETEPQVVAEAIAVFVMSSRSDRSLIQRNRAFLTITMLGNRILRDDPYNKQCCRTGGVSSSILLYPHRFPAFGWSHLTAGSLQLGLRGALLLPLPENDIAKTVKNFQKSSSS
jgi:hypothetical protein